VTYDADEAEEWFEVLPAAMGVEGPGAATHRRPIRRWPPFQLGETRRPIAFKDHRGLGPGRGELEAAVRQLEPFQVVLATVDDLGWWGNRRVGELSVLAAPVERLGIDAADAGAEHSPADVGEPQCGLLVAVCLEQGHQTAKRP
jgi:hypothetical protein